MAYIGVDPNIGDITFQTFTGTGSATAFTLAQSVVSGEALLVTIGNVVQEPGASKAYTAQGNTLTFSAAPANGDVITVRFFGRAVDQPTSYAMQLFKYVATNNQTAFTGADANGAILAFSGDDVDIYLNGVHLDSSDFTASNGDTITLGTGAATNDELVIRAYRAFTVTDTVSKASGGTFAGAVTFDAGANFGDNDKAVFGAGSDLNVWHNGSHSYVQDTGTGNLYLAGSNVIISNPTATETMAYFDDDGGASLWYDNAVKIATTNTGVDVTGTTTTDSLEVKNGTTQQLVIGNSGSYAGAEYGELLFKEGSTELARVKWNPSGNTFQLINNIAGPMTFATNGSERMRITSGGSVGIGTSSPSGVLHTAGSGDQTVTLQAGGESKLEMKIDGNSDGCSIRFSDSDAASQGQIRYQHSTDALVMYTNGNNERLRLDSNGHVQIQCNNSTGDLLWKEGTTDVWAIKTNGANSHLAFYDDYNNAERMRIANSGEVIIGATTTGASNCLRLDGNGTVMLVRVQNASDGTLRNGILFRNASDSTVGVIQVNSSSTNYATSSDHRLKEAVVDMTGAIDRVKALSPKRFNFIVNPDTTVDGFLAHEAQAVVPEAITGTHNEVDADGNAVMQGIDQSKLVPLLTGALQEAIAKIETLETKVAALEAGE